MRILLLIVTLLAGCSGEKTKTSEPRTPLRSNTPLRLDLAGTGLSDATKKCIIASKGDRTDGFDFDDRYKRRYKYKVVCEGVTYIIDYDAASSVIYGVTKDETPTVSENDNPDDPSPK